MSRYRYLKSLDAALEVDTISNSEVPKSFRIPQIVAELPEMSKLNAQTYLPPNDALLLAFGGCVGTEVARKVRELLN
jgi:hypothetical protein